jgi:alpha-glucosidase (family GH31 glycosyl hydrolase)
LHVALFPYRFTLAKEATDKGLPMVRHLALHFPDDPKAATVRDQFMLGQYLLVAPVLEDKARSRKVYLPGAGTTWFDYDDGTRYDGGKTHTVKAELMDIPVFAPAGAVVPTFWAKVQTLDRVSTAGIVDLDDGEQGTLGLQVFLGADGALDLYDGTRVKLASQSTPTTAPTIRVSGKALPACPASGAGCIETSARMMTIHVKATKAVTLDGVCGAATCLTLVINSAPRARQFRVILRW